MLCGWIFFVLYNVSLFFMSSPLLTPPDKKQRLYSPDSDFDPELEKSTELPILTQISNMAETNMMLQRKPRYPGRYYGYTALPRTQKTFTDYGPSWGNANPEQRKKRLADSYIGAGRYRKRRSYRGRGMYLGQGNYFTRMMHRQFNRTLAGQTPLGHLGKKVGRNLLGRVEGAVLGQGSYGLNGNAPVSNNLVAGGGLSVPTFASSQDETGALHVQHSEYVKDIYGLPWSGGSIQDTFKNDAIHLNPGIASNFPWLSQIAQNYEEYEIKQLMYCFKTRVGENLTTTDGQVGTIMMFTDYNATDKPRRTKQDMLQAYGTTVAKITDNDVLHGIECDPAKIKGDAHKFIRAGASTQDLHDFDWGLFQIAVDNTPETLSNKVIGELYVSYTVVFRKPRLFATLGLGISQDQFLSRVMFTHSNSVALAKSSENSLGTTISSVLTGVTSLILTTTIILPASLSGGIEVISATDFVGSGTPTYPATLRLAGSTGNVVEVRDMPVGWSYNDPNTSDVDPSNAIIAGNGPITSLIAHYDVQMASKDIDNTIVIETPIGGHTSAEPDLSVWICVRRYNNNESLDVTTFKVFDTHGASTPVPIGATLPVADLAI